MKCQLKILADAGTKLSAPEWFLIRLRRKIKAFLKSARRVILDPEFFIRNVQLFIHIRQNKASSAMKKKILAAPGNFPIKSLGLKPGEKVRVKSLNEIEHTLDEKGRFEGLIYIPSTMNKYCGGTYTVRKRINLFFDERRWQLLKLRDVVILDKVYCESRPDNGEAWAGCDRACFLFWKEAWLERITEK